MNDDLLRKLHAIDRDYRRLERVEALLQWDEETYLPPKGVEERAEQLALIRRLAHERFIRPETGEILRELGGCGAERPQGDPAMPQIERDFIALLRRNYGKAIKLPPDFVADCARAGGLSQAAWAEARKSSDFAVFLPHLKTMLDLARRKAEYWGYAPEKVYDGLLDIYEPGFSREDVAGVFKPLGERLRLLLEKIAACPRFDSSFLDAEYDIETQRRFNRLLLGKLGFDPSRGRLDESAHPFTTTLGADDVRITTRYTKDPLSSIFSVIHEAGHAFYEMAFPPEIRISSLADGASMGIHESQSRFWENVIARSLPFWEGLFPVLRDCFPGQLAGVGLEAFYRGVNRVRPSLIRVEADEVSYSLHIILRFELESRLFSGDLAPADLPGAWNEGMKNYLGVAPANDSEGVLQDIHWSQGAFGYFPSYALGNLYGLQFRKKLAEDIPGYEEDLKTLNFERIRGWLSGHIYRWGRRLKPPELLRRVTGEALSAEPFLAYIETKYAGIYGF